MKTVLFISSLQLYPAESGGQLRSVRFCEALAALGYCVEIVSLTGRKQDYLQRRKSFQQSLTERVTENVIMSPVLGALQFLAYRLDTPPLWVTAVLKLVVPARLQKAMEGADLVILDFPFLVSLLPKVRQRVWVNTHNAEFELWAHRPWLARAVRRIEKSCFEKAERVIFCSESDLKKFKPMVPRLAEKSFIVPNGLEPQDFQFTDAQKEMAREKYSIGSQQTVFLFVGSTFGPNKEAFNFLKQFSQNYREQLQAEGLVLVVAGTVSEQKESSPHWRVLGRVEDMKECLAMADFGLNAVTTGSGVNIKMVEYIASRMPVLSTAAGWRGLNVEDDVSGFLFNCEEAELFERITQAHALTPEERRQMAQRAYELNESSLEMGRSIEQLIDIEKQMQVGL